VLEVSGERGFQEASLYDLCIAYLGILAGKSGDVEAAQRDFLDVHLLVFNKAI
jgi:hypothetical protein